MVRQIDVERNADQGVWLMGRQSVPQAIDDLGSQGIHPIAVAILRFIWRYGRSRWTPVYQPKLAKDLGISTRTGQRYLKGLLQSGLIEFQPSKRIPQDRGYICEYKINWHNVYKKYNQVFQPQTHATFRDLTWLNGSKATTLPRRFFRSAVYEANALTVVTNNGTKYVLPRDSAEVVTYLVEEHYGRSIPAGSLDTIIETASTVYPRLLSLFSFALAATRTQPNSPGYYVTVLKDKGIKAMCPPNQKRSNSDTRIRTIRIQFPLGISPQMREKKPATPKTGA